MKEREGKEAGVNTNQVLGFYSTIFLEGALPGSRIPFASQSLGVKALSLLWNAGKELARGLESGVGTSLHCLQFLSSSLFCGTFALSLST